MVGNPLHDDIQGDDVVGAFQDDDVGEAFGGLHELLVHGLHGGQVLLHDVPGGSGGGCARQHPCPQRS